MGKKWTLKWELLTFLMLGWFIPMVTISIILSFTVMGRVSRQIEKTISTSMEKASKICSLRLSDCMAASKDASYHPDIWEAWTQYKRDGNGAKLYYSVSHFLEVQYKFNPQFDQTVLFFTEEPDNLYYTSNESVKGRHYPISYFRDNVQEKVIQEVEAMGTEIRFLAIEGRIYMIRNIMNRDFQPYAVIVMNLNQEQVFGSLNSVWEYKGMTVFCDGVELVRKGDAAYTITESLEEKEGTFLSSQGGTFYVCNRSESGDHEFLYAVSYNRGAVNVEKRSIIIVFVLLLIFMGPFVFVIFYFLNTRISRPVSELVKASKAIADGNYGIVVSNSGKNHEIVNLTENFNRMSEKLKTQFNKIFVEEIALRDANIHALQSQINPHFLNNTLEIINWTARMNGDEKVSRMIEALSIMMAATMDREKKPLIPLREELSYVQAYIYIISCRYGSQFHYEERVDDSLMDVMVPRLFIQPVVENAVEHGVDEDGERYVGLFIEGDAINRESLCIRVVNHGTPTKEEWERIHELLSDADTEETHALGIGIRNVNRRLKMLYGDESGLTITTDSQGNTISTILVKK